jgi:adenylate cyclase
MVSVILAVSAVLIFLDYTRSRAEALDHAETSMNAHSGRLRDKLLVIGSESMVPVTLIAELGTAFLAPPPSKIGEKIATARAGLAQAPMLDGLYVGYPDGSFFHAIRLTSEEWRKSLESPEGAALAIRTMSPPGEGRIEQRRFLDASGNLIDQRESAGGDYDPRARPWYRMGTETTGPASIGPYRMATTGLMGMALAQAHVRNPGIVVGADVVIETILDFLARDRITRGTITFIADADGRVAIHSDPTLMKRSGDDAGSGWKASDDPLVNGIIAADVGDRPVAVTGAGGRSYLVAKRPIDQGVLLAGHSVYVAAPMDELLATANAALRQSLYVSAAVVIVAVLLGLLLARLIARSLNDLTASADRLQELDFLTPITVPTRVSEIRSLGNAMNRARDAIHNFALYVPREFVRHGIESGRFSGRSAMREQVTAMFTDIYDFTTISEQSAPEEVVAMLSVYFDIFSEVVSAHDGTIIQFLGDSVFAMWNAPVAHARHAEQACRCALAVEERLSLHNAAQREKGLPEFRTRYGIHTGLALVGSVGAEQRLQYTAMGDTINLASRLEGINKQYGTSILASEATMELCRDAIRFRPLGTTTAKGRAAPVQLFEVVGVFPETSHPTGPGRQTTPA